MPADQFSVTTAHDMMDREVMEPILDMRDRTDAGTETIALVSRLGSTSSIEVRHHLAQRIAESADVDGATKVQLVARLFTHPSRDMRHLAFELVGEQIDADPGIKLAAAKALLDQAILPELKADALFGVLHITDLATEDRFAVAAPYVVDTNNEVREMAIAVLLKHPEIVNGDVYERLANIFEGAANHEDPAVADQAFATLQVVRAFYAANTALDAR
jgi:hypothetical protein